MEKKSIEYVLPEEIEKRSFEIIAAELASGASLCLRSGSCHPQGDPYQRRFCYAGDDDYSENAVEIAKNLIKTVRIL